MYTVTIWQLRACLPLYSYNEIVCMAQGMQFSELYTRYMECDETIKVNIADICNKINMHVAIDAMAAAGCYNRDLRMFGIWCAEQVQHLAPQSIYTDCIDAAKKYANGESSLGEMLYIRYKASQRPFTPLNENTYRAASIALNVCGKHYRLAASQAAAGMINILISDDMSKYKSANASQAEMFTKMCNGIAHWQK